MLSAQAVCVLWDPLPTHPLALLRTPVNPCQAPSCCLAGTADRVPAMSSCRPRGAGPAPAFAAAWNFVQALFSSRG